MVPRRCRARGIIGPVFVGSAMAVSLALPLLAPSSAHAQASNPDAGLLSPSLEGSSANPPSFTPGNTPATNQAPPAGKFTEPPRLGIPVYGSPTAFGAGDTGFDSQNRPHRRRVAQTPASAMQIAPPQPVTFDQVPEPPPQVPSTVPVLAPSPPPEVHPAKAASRPGAVLPPPPEPAPLSNPQPIVYPAAAAGRPGAVLPIPPPEYFAGSASTPPPNTPPPNTLPLGTVPHATLPIGTSDPYEALGIKAGSFLILPAIELSPGYNNNPERIPGGPGSFYYVVAPELHVRSDWASNSLTADVTGSYTGYTNDTFTPSLNAPYLNAKVDGTLDVTHDTKLLGEGRVNVLTTNPGSPNLQAGLSKLPIGTTYGGTGGVDEQLGRLDLTLKGTIDRSTFANSELTNGQSADNSWEDYNQYAGILRVGYELMTGLKPFVEVSADRRAYDEIDIFGENRNSDGASAKAGAALAIANWLTGEMAIGYLQRSYEDPIFPRIGGLTLDGSLLWQATALTSAKFTASSLVTESILQGVSGTFSRDVNVEVDHALRTWLIAMGQVGYGHDDYVGFGRNDNRYFASVGLTYKFNREMQLKGIVREDWLDSNVGGVGNSATSFLLTLRLQK